MEEGLDLGEGEAVVADEPVHGLAGFVDELADDILLGVALAVLQPVGNEVLLLHELLAAVLGVHLTLGVDGHGAGDVGGGAADLGGGVQSEDGCAVFCGADIGGHAGAAQAHDDDVVALQGDGVGLLLHGGVPLGGVAAVGVNGLGHGVLHGARGDGGAGDGVHRQRLALKDAGDEVVDDGLEDGGGLAILSHGDGGDGVVLQGHLHGHGGGDAVAGGLIGGGGVGDGGPAALLNAVGLVDHVPEGGLHGGGGHGGTGDGVQVGGQGGDLLAAEGGEGLVEGDDGRAADVLGLIGTLGGEGVHGGPGDGELHRHVAAVALGGGGVGGRLGGSGAGGGGRAGGGLLVAAAAGGQGERHGPGERQSGEPFHLFHFFLLKSIYCGFSADSL